MGSKRYLKLGLELGGARAYVSANNVHIFRYLRLLLGPTAARRAVLVHGRSAAANGRGDPPSHPTVFVRRQTGGRSGVVVTGEHAPHRQSHPHRSVSIS